MTTRHGWGDDYVADLFELKKRDIQRRLFKDSSLSCLVKSCHKKPKRHESVYYPAVGMAQTNKIIGHVECVDRACNELKAKNGNGHKAAHVATPAPIVEARKPAKPKYQASIETSPVDELLSLSSGEILDRIAAGLEGGKTYQDGYERGCRETAAKIAMLLRARGIEI